MNSTTQWPSSQPLSFSHPLHLYHQVPEVVPPNYLSNSPFIFSTSASRTVKILNSWHGWESRSIDTATTVLPWTCQSTAGECRPHPSRALRAALTVGRVLSLRPLSCTMPPARMFTNPWPHLEQKKRNTLKRSRAGRSRAINLIRKRSGLLMCSKQL